MTPGPGIVSVDATAPSGTAEWDWFCALTGAVVRGDARVPQAPAELDDSAVVDLAVRHRCLGLLAAGVESRGATGGLGERAMARLRALRQTLVVRSLFQQARLLELLQALSAHGLRAMPLKGPALSAALYGDATLRTSDDLDIWVHPGDFLDAVACLEARGFVPFIRLSEPEARAHMEAGWDRGFRSPEGDLTVELCTGMTPRYFGARLAPDAMVAATREVAVGGGRVRVPGPEVLLVLLCAHGMKHRWDRLVWVADVARLLGRDDLSWTEVARHSRTAGALRMTAVGIHLAAGLLGVRVPEAALPAFRLTPIVARLVERCRDVLAGAEGGAHSWGEVRLHLAARECFRDRLRYVALAVFTPGVGDWRWVRLPSACFGLYWGVRPLRLALFRLLPRLRSAGAVRA